MARYAIVITATRKVDNVTEWTGDEWAPPAGTVCIPVSPENPVGIGDDFDVATGAFTRPVVVDDPPIVDDPPQ